MTIHLASVLLPAALHFIERLVGLGAEEVNACDVEPDELLISTVDLVDVLDGLVLRTLTDLVDGLADVLRLLGELAGEAVDVARDVLDHADDAVEFLGTEVSHRRTRPPYGAV